MGYEDGMEMADEGPVMRRILRRERQARAVARAAARVASERSLPATLDALAREIQQATGVSAVQILVDADSDERLHMLGMAGFPSSRRSEFSTLLLECQRRGADLRLRQALRTGRAVVIPHRYREVMADPAWEPLHAFHREPLWDAFAAVPIPVRDATVGVLNVFAAPGQRIDHEGVEFLLAMAEQAGLAIDYAYLLERERGIAQTQERRQLAQDLHDSVVQQMFSLGMLARTLSVLADTGDPARLPQIGGLSAEIEDITGSVMKDLRQMVHRMRSTAVAEVGLHGALEQLSDSTHRRTGVRILLEVADALRDEDGDRAEDVYHVASEAVHNAVKHASASEVRVEVTCAGDEGIELLVADDGGGAGTRDGGPTSAKTGSAEGGHGREIMRSRVGRWGGELDIDLDGPGGATVHARFPRASDDGRGAARSGHEDGGDQG